MNHPAEITNLSTQETTAFPTERMTAGSVFGHIGFDASVVKGVETANEATGEQIALTSEIRDLEVMMRIGLLEEERKQPQRVLFSVKMTQLVSGEIDDLGQCLDYGALAEHIMRLANEPHTDLLETVGQKIVHDIWQDKRVIEVSLSIMKPDIIRTAKAVGITIVKRRAQ